MTTRRGGLSGCRRRSRPPAGRPAALDRRRISRWPTRYRRCVGSCSGWSSNAPWPGATAMSCRRRNMHQPVDARLPQCLLRNFCEGADYDVFRGRRNRDHTYIGFPDTFHPNPTHSIECVSFDGIDWAAVIRRNLCRMLPARVRVRVGGSS
ncbi:hypothetical protein C8F04DRAFT_1101628 [Mycena alexandri]|uniref:Uncharacterized protein n=1 Tax=Mycena alexandri TaxID=1745969 RepID=A0AAD6SZK6_9AGAR|nr:hypothetical protein C8F04DRAFT_1101628 [Mycena alexandri]